MPQVDLGMEPLFVEAEKTGKWFFQRYTGIWISPNELRSQQAAGRYRWGAANWELRDPEDYISEARLKAERASAELRRVIEKVAETT